MPKGTAVYRCVQHLKAKGTKGNPYAICQASTGQSYATGKKLYKGASPHKGWREAHFARHGIKINLHNS